MPPKPPRNQAPTVEHDLQFTLRRKPPYRSFVTSNQSRKLKQTRIVLAKVSRCYLRDKSSVIKASIELELELPLALHTPTTSFSLTLLTLLLSLSVAVTWITLATSNATVLGLGNFIVIALTLRVLIWYAYGNNSIARFSRDRWVREGVLTTSKPRRDGSRLRHCYNARAKPLRP